MKKSNYLNPDFHWVFDIRPVPWGRGVPFKGRVLTPKKTRDFEKEIRQLAKQRCERVTHLPVRLELIFSFKRPKKPKHPIHIVRPDLDNLEKSLKDALNGVLYKDDCQVYECHKRKQYADTDSIELKAWLTDELLEGIHG